MSSRVAVWWLVALSVVGATGATQWLVFSQPSALKYGLTVAGPLVAAALLLVRERLGLLIAMLLVLAPFGTFSATVLGVTISLLAVLVAMVFVLAVWERAPGGTTRSPFVGLAAGSFAILMCFAAARSDDPVTAFAPLAVIAASAYALWTFLRRGGDARWITTALVVAASLQGSLALFEFVTGRTLSLYSDSLASGSVGRDYFFGLGPDVARSAAAFSDPISLGNMLCLAAPFAIIGLARSLDRAQAGAAVAHAAASSLVIAGLAVSFSRASWLAFAASTAAAVVVVGRGRRETLVVTIGFAGALTALLTSFLGPTLIDRATSILNPTSSSVRSFEGDMVREAIWRTTVDVVELHPAIGVGSGNLVPFLARNVAETTVFSHAHSTYLQVAAEAGVLAALALVVTVLVGFVGSVRAAAVSRSAAPTAAALVAMATMWVTDYTARYSTVAVYVVAVLVLGLHAASAVGVRGPRPGRPASTTPAAVAVSDA